MEVRPLGTAPFPISALGLGCWSFGGGSYWGPQDERAVEEVVHRALDLGITYFDTAEAYNDGRSEEALGRALGRRRAEAIIGTKVSPHHTTPDALRKALEGSLRRLGTDWVDLYMLHWPINRPSVEHFVRSPADWETVGTWEDAVAALLALQSEGKVRAIGVSNHGVQQLRTLAELGLRPVCDQLPYNLLSRAIEGEILPYCRSHGIGVIAYMPLLQGLLTGKYARPEDVRPVLARTRHFRPERGLGSRHGTPGAEEEVFAALAALRALAAEAGVPLAVLALSWVLHQPGISCALVGARSLEQLTTNVQAAAFPLTAELDRRLREVTEPVLVRLGFDADYYEPPSRSRIA